MHIDLLLQSANVVSFLTQGKYLFGYLTSAILDNALAINDVVLALFFTYFPLAILRKDTTDC